MTQPRPDRTRRGDQARRVVVTSPRMRASLRQRQYAAQEIDAQTSLGQVYMSSLIRVQLRLGLLVLAVVGALLLGLPLLFAVAPGLGAVDAFGLPLPWLLLGVVVHPALIAAAWFYVRHAERNEREFAELVERS
ncbi:hypothetical protein ABN028_15740 [Actinopolymorpha sp. B17G11]|uniref:hypothetical protein n=1 Tax=unclassified Actinopolymorpha TaxID=2627063 RepID=UPI0032D91C24